MTRSTDSGRLCRRGWRFAPAAEAAAGLVYSYSGQGGRIIEESITACRYRCDLPMRSYFTMTFVPFFSLILLLVFAVSGCGTAHYKLYPGTARPDEVAFLVWEQPMSSFLGLLSADNKIILRRVDDQIGPEFESFRVRRDSEAVKAAARTMVEYRYFDSPYRIELLPGRHTLLVDCQSATKYEATKYESTSYYSVSSAPIPLAFIAEAAHTYTPRARLENEKWIVWVEDITERPH